MDMQSAFDAQAKIKVIGVGGAGGNAVNRMIEDGLEGVEFISINTDAAALDANKASRRMQIGTEITKGLGAGAKPEMGKLSVEENREELEHELAGTDMVFIAAGMGGGTGTGAAPVVAEIARASGALTVAVVTKPFLFEGKVRERNAISGIEELRKHVDTIIVIQNQKLLSIVPKGTPILESFKTADGVLNDAAKGIAKLITVHGLINVDFADVKAVMTDMGDALMGVGESDDPENRGFIAADAAINSPLLEEIDISGAEGLLVNFTGGEDLSLDDVTAAQERINDAIGANMETNVIFGAVIDPKMTGRVQVTVVVTGFNKNRDRTPLPLAEQPSVIAPTQGDIFATDQAVVTAPAQETISLGDLPPIVDIATASTPAEPLAMPAVSEASKDLDKPAYIREQERQEAEIRARQDELDRQTQSAKIAAMQAVSGSPTEDANYFTPPELSGDEEKDREIPTFLRQQMQ